MAFVCTIEDGCEVSVFQKGGAWLSAAPIGYDDEEDIDYSILIGFEPNGAGLEYFFCIVAADNETGGEDFLFIGTRVRRLINEEDRDLILFLILENTERLVRLVNPDWFIRCTHDADMPSKALEKHELVTQVFRRCGYITTKADIYHGKRTWVMERASQTAVASEEGGRYDADEDEGADHGPPASD